MSSCWRTGDAWLASKKTQGVCCGLICILNTAKLPVSKHPLFDDVMVSFRKLSLRRSTDYTSGKTDFFVDRQTVN